MAHTAKKWILAQNFADMPKLEDFKLVEEPVSCSLKPGEIIVEALYLSVDPFMRLYMVKVGEAMPGSQVARVKVSHHPDYPEGSLLLTRAGWRTLTLITDCEQVGPMGRLVQKLPELGDLPPSLALGCLGAPGLTAYFGLLDRGQPKAGEVVLVSAAAGATGSVAGQIAKIKGCTVIGSTGTEEKCDWLRKVGFDHVFNYKEIPVDEALKKVAPEGIDIYFDNVGGDFSFAVLQNHMKVRGRVIVCGAISQYNSAEAKVSSVYGPVIFKQLDVLGIRVGLYRDRFSEGVSQLLRWIEEGKLKYRETITDGFERMPEAFISLFQGGNTGKAIVKV